MNPNQLKRYFPQASASVLAANAHDYGDGKPAEAPSCAGKAAPARPVAESGQSITPNENHTHAKLPHTQPSQQTGALGSDHEGEAQGSRRPHVCFTLFRARLLDVDAKYGSIKDVLDGLAYAGLIHGDREDQITLEVRQQKVAHFKEEKTVIELDLP